MPGKPWLEAETYLAIAQEELAWLAEAGFEATQLRQEPRRFLWQLASDRAQVVFGLDIMRAEVTLAVGPPADDGQPTAGLGARLVSVAAVRRAHGMPVIRTSEVFMPQPPAAAEEGPERLRACLRGLRDLRDVELAGNWSRFEDAKAAECDLASEFAQRFKDPPIRRLMGGDA